MLFFDKLDYDFLARAAGAIGNTAAQPQSNRCPHVNDGMAYRVLRIQASPIGNES